MERNAPPLYVHVYYTLMYTITILPFRGENKTIVQEKGREQTFVTDDADYHVYSRKVVDVPTTNT